VAAATGVEHALRGVGTEGLNDPRRHEGVGACGELIAAALFINLAEGDGAGLAVGSREDSVVQRGVAVVARVALHLQ